MNIPEIWLKIKRTVEKRALMWAMPFIVVLVAAATFGLGRLSALETNKSQVSISQAAGMASVVAIPPGGYVVASRTGHAYYFPWCGGAENMDPSNQVWFKTERAAKNAGYLPAKNCKGLGK